MSDTIYELTKSMENGTRLEILYMGGSQPGSLREISVLQINKDSIRARCYSSNAVKTFIVDKIKLNNEKTSETQALSWGSIKSDYEDIFFLSELYEKTKEKLLTIGWHVELVSESEYSHITLHKIRKNGVPLKKYSVGIFYQKYASDMVMNSDYEIVEDNIRERIRPWGVQTKEDGNVGTWTDRIKAFELFVKNAETYR